MYWLSDVWSNEAFQCGNTGMGPCHMIQFEKVHSTTSSTRLGAVSDLQIEDPCPVLCTCGRNF
jgi:hypothetical protein